ncbi:hypothetical protein C8R44DRAFT_728628 [Mycena epipterygia]|nr:hypothetical protein C8R44DRAFT_728628 [Mycena epipterygia]
MSGLSNGREPNSSLAQETFPGLNLRAATGTDMSAPASCAAIWMMFEVNNEWGMATILRMPVVPLDRKCNTTSGLQVEFDELMGSLRGLAQVDQILERARSVGRLCSKFKGRMMDDKQRSFHVDQMQDEFLHGTMEIPIEYWELKPFARFQVQSVTWKDDKQGST